MFYQLNKGFLKHEKKRSGRLWLELFIVMKCAIDKPGEKITVDSVLTVKGKTLPYVSRGGLKLEKALKVFDIDIKDKILLDIGSSTGGFTDCALQNGAIMSYAVDVGYNQLAWKLRSDDRVVVMERTNFRYVTPSDLNGPMPNFLLLMFHLSH